MNRLFTRIFAVCLLGASSATAADLGVTPIRQRPEPAALSWAGFYIGAHGGYGWGLLPRQDTTAPGVSEIKLRGWIAGGHAGYNWQYGMWVGGLELDLDATGIKGSAASTTAALGTTTAQSESRKLDYMGTGRARVGFLPWPGILLYGTGGLAWAQATTTNAFQSVSLIGTTSSVVAGAQTLFGVAGGAGVEASLGNFGMGAVLLRLEYLHYDFGGQGSSTTTSSAFGPAFTTTSKTGHLTVDAVRGGASLKF